MTETGTEQTPSRRSKRGEKLLRSACAIVTTLAFICSPFSALAQQSGQADSDGAAEQAKPSDASKKPEATDKPAGRTPTLFLLPTQGVNDELSSIIPERIGEMLRAQLKDKRRADLLPSYDNLMAQGGGNPNAALADATRMYTSGIGLLTAGQNERAAKTFQKSVDSLEKNLGDLDNFNVLVDAYRNMSLAYFLAGYDFDARKKMKVYANLRPNETLDAEKFPKELREVYTAEADKVKKAGPGKLTISADSDEAAVFVDGVDKGQAPVVLDDIGYGYHYLVVRGANGAVWSEQIRVRGRSKEQKFEAKLGGSASETVDAESNQPAFYSGLLGAVASGKFSDEQLRPYLEELHSRTGAQYMAWVLMTKKKSKYVAVPFIYHAEAGQLVRESDVPFTVTLSNLRVGVNQLANAINDAVGRAPGAKLVSAVDLTSPAAPTKSAKPAVAAKKPAPETPSEPVAQKPVEAAKPVTPPPPVADASEDDDDSNMWLWVGAGGAAVVVAGAIVGGVLLASDDPDPSGGQFDAALSW